LKPDPDELASAMLDGRLEALPAEEQRVARYVWARAALDWGILLLIGRDTQDGTERLICTLQEDGSCYFVEQPPGWSFEDEALYVARFKARLGGR
jgi:hypothetical protein